MRRREQAPSSLLRGLFGLIFGVTVMFVSLTNALDPAGQGWRAARLIATAMLAIELATWVVLFLRERR
jgi:hypothetical protein